ncbi:helix-turn-helix domain-containing protein [Amycolatopsis speibonae]|uniref:Helix-turn-helix domain-containing protein n=1 Tax=Amycolatopsis speibonae TaxID=1450224 RepID=A0ABV7P4G8_9PSEU
MTAEKNFAIGMRDLRAKKGVSQVALATALVPHGYSIDSTAITRMEHHADGRTDARTIRLGEAVAIAEVLGTTVDQMCHLGSTWRARRIAALRAELAALTVEED